MKNDTVLSPPIPYLAKFWFLRFGPKCCWAIKLQDSLKRIISRTKWMMKFIVAMEIDIEVFYKLILPFWVWVVKHAQSTQNNKFAISLQYVRENLKDEVDFLPADKHQRFLQIDTITLDVCSQTMPKLPKIASLLFLWNTLRSQWWSWFFACK